MTTNLDTETLRTLVVAMDGGGSFARAAARVGRSQSAVSLQMRRLEEQVGQRLFRKVGRGLALTDAGETVLGYARRMLELNDEALAAVSARAVAGTVRLGLPQDFAENRLPTVLARFARAHPAVLIEARVDRQAALLDALGRGKLDLALVFGGEDRGAAGTATRVAELPTVWIGSPAFRPTPGKPLPLVLFEPPCLFRQAGLDALDRAGRPWRLAFSSPNLAGLWAAVGAGLGLTIRTPEGVPPHLRILKTAALPALPKVRLALHTVGSPQPGSAVTRLREILLETLGALRPGAGQSSAATASISTEAFFGNPATATVERAGGTSPK